MRFHEKNPFFLISIGGKAFSQKSGLSSHNTFQHPDPNKVLPVVSWWHLNILFFVLLTLLKSTFFQKKKREWKTEPTPCERCGKILMSKYSLEKHILHTHENVRPFNCDTCGKTFKSNSNLKEHVSQVHHNKRPFNCHLCDFGSSHKSRLEVRKIE